jgi:hypothetical protein
MSPDVEAIGLAVGIELAMGIELEPAMLRIASEADGAGLPMTIVSSTSTAFATGLDAPTSVSGADPVFWIVMYATPTPAVAGVARTHGSVTEIEALPPDEQALRRSVVAMMGATSPPRRAKRGVRVIRPSPDDLRRPSRRMLDRRVEIR